MRLLSLGLRKRSARQCNSYLRHHHLVNWAQPEQYQLEEHKENTSGSMLYFVYWRRIFIAISTVVNVYYIFGYLD